MLKEARHSVNGHERGMNTSLFVPIHSRVCVCADIHRHNTRAPLVYTLTWKRHIDIN